MADTTVSFRVDKALHAQMKLHDEVNWSAVLRRAIRERIENTHPLDRKKAREAARITDDIRKSGVFAKGKSTTEILREWREKRRR